MSKYKNLFFAAVLSFAVCIALPACSSDSEEAPPPSSGGPSEGNTGGKQPCSECAKDDYMCIENCYPGG